MPLFSKEKLLKQVSKDLTRTVRVAHPTEGEGEVVIRRICSLMEQESLNDRLQRQQAMKVKGEPSYAPYSNDAIMYALYLSEFVVEPKLSFEEWLQSSENIGPVLTYLFGEIMKFSGMSQTMLDGGAAELEKKPFQDDTTASGDGTGETAD